MAFWIADDAFDFNIFTSTMEFSAHLNFFFFFFRIFTWPCQGFGKFKVGMLCWNWWNVLCCVIVRWHVVLCKWLWSSIKFCCVVRWYYIFTWFTGIFLKGVWCDVMKCGVVWIYTMWFYAKVDCDETGWILEIVEVVVFSIHFHVSFFPMPKGFLGRTHTIFFCLMLMTPMSLCRSPVCIWSFWRCLWTAILVYELVFSIWRAFHTKTALEYDDRAF